MTSLPKTSEDDLQATLEKELDKVIPLPSTGSGRSLVPSTVRAPDPTSEAEQIAAVHRQGIAMREQRISDKRKEMAATIASYERGIAEANERHAVEVRRLEGQIAETKASGERDVAADLRIVEASRAALKVLE